MDTFVAVDLETTGLDTVSDEIIEIGAVLVERGELVDSFSQLVRPIQELPLRTQRITGITPDDLVGKPPIETVLRSFRAFAGDAPLVAHNADFDGAFLKQVSHGTLGPGMLDSLTLSRMVLPHSARHDLATLMRHYELTQEEHHRALSDARLDAQVWLRLVDDLYALPLTVLEQMASTFKTSTHSLRPVVLAAADAARAAHPVGTAPIESILKNFEGQVGKRATKQQADPEHEPVDPAVVTALLDSGHELDHELASFERRPEQLKMAELVTRAINDEKILMVEAGTGTGKSMAYLTPAVLWAHQNDERVVVSTNTKNLQEQLALKDIPLLESTLGFPIRYAIAKGRSNYLCVLKLFQLVRDLPGDSSEEDRMRFIPLLTWAASTDTGDISENGAYYPFQARHLWERMTTLGDDCAGRNCTYYNNCFLMKARQKVQEAQLVIANHSVVFSDIATDNALLPEYGHLIIDEAHNLESVATEQLRIQINKTRVVRILGRLYRRSGKPHGSGLVPRVLDDLVKMKAQEEWKQALEARALDAIDFSKKLTADMDQWGLCLGNLFSDASTENRIRYEQNNRSESVWAPIRATAQSIIATLGGLVKSITFLANELAELDKDSLPFHKELAAELEGQASQLKEISMDTELLVAASETNRVYWAERIRRGRRPPLYQLCAAPLNIAELLKTELYDKKRSVVLTSATMTVKQSFNYLQSRLGLDRLPEQRVRSAVIGSSFDYATQVKVCLANFLPEPNQKDDFEEAVSKMLIGLHRKTEGRGLVLFTSYQMLKRVYEAIKEPLESDGIQVMAQGVDGSRRALSRAFRDDVSSVLLGTSSFWEGVDFAGESLTALTIVRLPFGVVSDPITAARAEQIQSEGKDPFLNYSVPNAVIRFRQGFGRLIRTKTDHGVVVIADKRTKSKRYGSTFLKSLPAATEIYPTADALFDGVGRFLADHSGASAP